MEQNDSVSLQYMKGIGEKRAALLRRLGVNDLGQLLTFYPRAYIDFSNPEDIRTAPLEENCCVRATVLTEAKESRIRKGMTLYKLTAQCGQTLFGITYFNTGYTAKALKEGQEYLFYGKVTGNLLKREMVSPLAQLPDKGGLRPVYSQTEGLSSTVITKAVQNALERFSDRLEDPFPAWLAQRYELMEFREAVNTVHFPPNTERLAAARRRLIFQELLALQLGMFLLKRRNRQKASHQIEIADMEPFYRLLPFRLTGAQQRAIGDCMKDMAGPVPMSRLIQGDVGSGKTAVAAALCYHCARSGCQSALMAPTEILAQQHYEGIGPLLARCGVRTALLTGSTRAAEKKQILRELADGTVQVLIGTHALISDQVVFRNLGFVVTDEQHRFGVAQRAALSDKGVNPHLLVMSATPIPRTMALIVYGDLDISILDEMPPGRQPVDTFVVTTALRQRMYRFIGEQIDQGRQVYVVCPLVEDGVSELESVSSYRETLSERYLPGREVGILHGKMKPKEKEAVMERFTAGRLPVLVSTTVIEVGVNVPNATVMIVENAERFGLSQLHQLRGRVGRGNQKSYCILVSDTGSETSKRRLSVMKTTSDGFKIAEADLTTRGPGDFFGHRQHGLPALKIADMLTDMETMKIAQDCSRAIIESDPSLSLPENSGLRRLAQELFDSVGANGLN